MIDATRALGALLLLWTAQSWAADIQVTVDRSPVRLDESFHIVFSATEQPDDQPDFSPLRQDFDIRNQGQSTQVSMVNGQYSRQIQWTLTAMAKRAGDLTLPSIAFGRDHSPAIGLRVEAGAAPDTAGQADNGELFMEVEAEPRNPYVQAQVLYTVRILRQVGLSNARLDEPKLDNAVLQRLGEDVQYETWRNGQPYQVIERRFAIFPQQSGRTTVQSPVLEAEAGFGRNALFNRLFNQPGQEDAVRLRGKTIELEVRPIPAQFTGKHWLPAQALKLSDAFSKDPLQIAAGEPLTRTLKVEAQASTVGNLPELATATVDGLQAYPDQPALNEERTAMGLNPSREEKVALIPARPGSYTLPEIVIPWWNTQTDRQEIARIPARTLTVTAAGPAPQPATPSAMETFPATPASMAPPQTPAVAAAAERPWQWIGLAAFCALGWLFTALAWWRRERRPATETVAALAPPAVSERNLRRHLRQTCQANDAAAARLALLAWAQAHWRENPPRHLDQLARRAGPELAGEIERLNRASYGNTAVAWNGQELWQALERLPADGRPAKDDGLEPMYRAG